MTFPSQAQFMGPPSPVVFYDRFVGPGGQLLVDRVDEIDIDLVGTGWSVLVGGTSFYTIVANTAGVVDQQPGIVVCDSGISNLKYTVDVVNLFPLGKFRFHFRVQDATNFLAVDFDRNAGTVTLDEVVAGAPNQLRQISRTIPAIFGLKIIARGNFIQIEETSPTPEVLIQAASSQFVSATQCGFGENGGGADATDYNLDNFRIERV